MEKGNESNDRRLPPCTLAPEWAEHSRLQSEEPCDDGRGAFVSGTREDDRRDAEEEE